MESALLSYQDGFGLKDFFDVFLVAIVIYYVYSLIKGTVAVNILVGIAFLIGVFLIVLNLEMRLLTVVFGTFISIGLIALIVVFQQQIRGFLLHLGKNISSRRKTLLWKFLGGKKASDKEYGNQIKIVVDACRSMSKSRTGALIVFTRYFDDEYYQSMGEYVDAALSKRLLESIFFKNSPLHDGAVIIVDFRVMTASSILQVSNSDDLPPHFGLRHRAAIGVTEVSDAIAVIVSEETGDISFAKDGNVNVDLTPDELEQILKDEL